MKLALLLLLLGQKFYPDDPIREDRDRAPIPKPQEIELSATYDMLENTFAAPEVERPIPPARNVNTVGEVPDSSWFTNRIGVRDLSPEELVTGPGGTGPPDTSQTLTIIAAKQGGITPGFTVRDRRENVYFVKFDPAEFPSLSTGADVIAKNFFHAIGYNVPEAHIVYVNVDSFEIAESAVVTLPGDKQVPMDREYLEFMLGRAARVPDGNVRAVASLLVPGELLGPFRFFGTRPDDPNDIFAHEHRRELRGYRVFCAWLNHDDSRSINTLDTFIDGHVEHYLIDFGSTLGSGSDVFSNIAPQHPRAGHEYVIDLEAGLRVAYTFGLAERAWRRIPYPYPELAEIGRIESEHFEPAKWKPEYPNAAFERMRPDDAFWAAKIVARFDDDAIRTIVKTGDYLSAEAETYLADTLIARRDKVTSYYFSLVNPLDGFRIDDTGALVFDNLTAEAAVEYEIQWYAFDNSTGQTTPLGLSSRTQTARLPIPERARRELPYLMARIRTHGAEPRHRKSVDVFLRRAEAGYEVVGVDREL